MWSVQRVDKIECPISFVSQKTSGGDNSYENE